MKCGTWHAIKKHDTPPAQFLLGQAVAIFPFVHDAKSGWPANSMGPQ